MFLCKESHKKGKYQFKSKFKHRLFGAFKTLLALSIPTCPTTAILTQPVV